MAGKRHGIQLPQQFMARLDHFIENNVSGNITLHFEHGQIRKVEAKIFEKVITANITQ